MDTPNKLSVFLCHSSADKSAVRELYKRLSSQNWIDPWLDSEKLLPGQDWNTEIQKALETAHAVIVTLSKGSVNKEGYLQREFKYALDIALEKPEGSIFIIPLRLEEIDKQELPRSLRTLQHVDYFPKSKRVSAFERILESLRARAAKFGIVSNSASLSSVARTQIETKRKHSINEVSRQKIITSNASFPIREIPFSQNRNFSGRQAVLESIRKEFTGPQTSIPVYAITGLGGIGKTQIAVQYSYQYASEYDLVWWIRSETDASLSADYQSLSNALLLPVKTKAEQIVFINVANNYLENTDRKWLLVFDNVESQEKIKTMLPKKGNGNILITSQNPEWRQIASDSHLIPFTEKEGREFLSRRINERDTQKADNLTKLLGGLPLAMEQASAYIGKRGTPIDLYVTMFEAQQQELWKKEFMPKDYHSTLTTTWIMAFKQIRQVQPSAEELLSIFSFFAPDAIPLSIFKSQVDLLPESMRNLVINPLELEECIAALYEYSLVERDGEFISVHRLIQDVVRSRLSSDNLQKWLSFALEVLKKTFSYDEYNIHTWAICAQILPHALAVSGYAEKYAVGLETASDIYQKVGEYIKSLGEYGKAEAIFYKSINIRTELLGEGSDKLAESLNYLGEIYQEQARFDDAFNLYQHSSNIFKASGDSYNRTRIRNHNNLGRLFVDKSDFETARKYFEEALLLSRTSLGENHPDVANSLNDLGNLFCDQGDFEIALKCHKDALEIRRAILGEKHPITARSLSNLASVFYEKKDLTTALDYQTDVLDIERTVFGENHPNIADSSSNLGFAYTDLGLFESAREHFEKARNIRSAIFGKDHPDFALSLYGIGYLLSRQKKYVEARIYMEQALSIYEKAYGAQHHNLIKMLSNLANVMIHLRLFPKAKQYVQRAIKICQEAKEKYAECEAIKQIQKNIPFIGKQNH